MPLIDANDCVLIVIDIQEQFYGPDRTDVDRAELSEVVDRAAWITGVAAALDVPIVVTEEDSQTNAHTYPVIMKQVPDHAAVLPKHAFAVPDNPEIRAAVRSSNVSTAVLIGFETDICVAHSALRLQEDGWTVAVVEDALYSPQEGHRNGMRRLSAAGVDVVSTKELFYDWLRNYQAARSFNTSHGAALPLPAGVVL